MSHSQLHKRALVNVVAQRLVAKFEAELRSFQEGRMAQNYEPKLQEEGAALGKPFVKDAPKLNLDSYIADYKGKTRIHRLFHIGTSSSYLSLDALKAAVTEAKKGRDVELYRTVITTMHKIFPFEPKSFPPGMTADWEKFAKLDTAWMERVSREVKAETERLELELKGYKNNLIKESIRMGYVDLGQHYHEIGDLSNAAKAYSKEREFCQMPSHLAIMDFSLIHVSIDQGKWLDVQSNVQKLRQLTQKATDQERQQAKLSAAMGLAQLESKAYKEAAISFIATDPRMIPKEGEVNEDELFNEIITSNDVAVYGGLCALASMDRNELQKKVLDNANFRQYLERESHIRKAISLFVSSKFSQCLTILESYKADYLLDIHLYRHIDEIYFRIRSKAIVQYFIPFSVVTFAELAKAFNTTEEDILKITYELIDKETLPARLDMEFNTLVSIQVDERAKAHEEALETASDWENAAYQRLLRFEMIQAGLEVKAPKGPSGGQDM